MRCILPGGFGGPIKWGDYEFEPKHLISCILMNFYALIYVENVFIDVKEKSKFRQQLTFVLYIYRKQNEGNSLETQMFFHTYPDLELPKIKFHTSIPYILNVFPWLKMGQRWTRKNVISCIMVNFYAPVYVGNVFIYVRKNTKSGSR